MTPRRFGRFYIDLVMIERAPDDVKAALSSCIVVKAECMYHRDAIEYVAISDSFDEVPANTEPPLYIAEMTAVKGVPHFLAWRRAPHG